MSKKYNVTLNFTFSTHHPDDAAEFNETPDEENARTLAFERTDDYYAEHSIIDHIKTNDAMGFVESLYFDGEILSAEWDKDEFQIHMVLETEETPEEIEENLKTTSLEDGEYEGCGDFGWVVMTRGPNNERFNGDFHELKNYWEYGLTDYRWNPIVVKEITAE
jgi:hypothetical protein